MKHKNLIVLAVAMLALILASCSTGSDTTSWISIEGNKFVNEKGETMIFQGVNIRDPHNLEENGHWTLEHMAEAKAWGANIIRLPIHPAAWRDRGEEAYLALIDQGVEWARELDLYLILDWHSIGNLKEEMYQHKMYVTTMEETRSFWASVAERYASEPVVAMYELFNEPTISGDRFGDCSWEDWKAINEELVDVIREKHPKSVILAAGFNWAYDLSQIKDQPLERDGIAYVSHPYPQKTPAPWLDAWEETWGYVADKYPLILTEIGFAYEDEPGVHVPVHGDETYGDALVKYTAEKGISWVVWCFDPDWSPYMFTDWDYTPTAQGKYFKKVMLGD